VDVERRARLEHGIRLRERLGERLRGRERAVGGRVHVCEVEHRPDPAAPARDLDDVVRTSELPHATHHLDAERHRAVLLLQPRA
jgi:hypothetical protein